MDQSLVIIQDGILRQLQDNDLTVVRAALSLDRLSTLLNPSDLTEVLDNLFRRCIGLLTSELLYTCRVVKSIIWSPYFIVHMSNP